MNWFAWSLLSAFFAALTAICAKVGVKDIDSNLATAIRTAVILIVTWGLALMSTNMSAVADLSKRTWLFLILSGLATGASWVCYFRALQMGQASRVAPVDKLSVVFAIALAGFCLNEKLTWHHWAGGTLIVGGAALLAWKA
jgi:transporter family protein